LIDLHCHLLPGVDDGAQNLQESLELARMAVANGITHAVMTPHIQIGRYDNERKSILSVAAGFREALAAAEIPLQIGVAAEVRIDPAIIPWLSQERIPFLGVEDGLQIMLLEFPHTHILPGTEKLVDHLLKRGIRPMVAHPERNGEVIHRLEKIEPLVKAGCMLQVTAGSVAGRFGPQSQLRAREMLERGWVDAIATDAHNIRYRPPDLESGRAAAASFLGDQEARRLVVDRPAQITAFQFT